MALIGSAISGEVGLRLLLSPSGSNILVRTACCTVGIALPVYSTFKALEKNDSSDKEKWLLYWAAYGSFTLVESLSDKVISWFPFYYHMKFAFLVWLQLRSNGGAKQLYDGHLRPFLLRHQGSLDKILAVASREIVKLVSRHQGEIAFLRGLVLRCSVAAADLLRAIVNPGQAAGPRSARRRQIGPVEEIEEPEPPEDEG